MPRVSPRIGNILFPRRFRTVAALLAATFLLGVAMVGAIAVSADSTPDDMAYPIKRAAENAQLLFSFGDAGPAFHLELAARRLAELRTIAERRGVVDADLLAEVAGETDKAVAGLERAVNREELGEKLADLTARQQEILKEVPLSCLARHQRE
ncbi:MAG: DUF5667 domain-containing protein [Dehalococcoidia bacterium]|nr:DUF5667 domain-containing protein [Dehalococcoidia bacterium]